MHVRLMVLFAPAAALSGCLSLGARESLVVDRPDFTDGVVLMAPGETQVESGVTASHVNGTNRTSVGELFLRVGMTRRAEMRVAVNSLLRERTAGRSNRGREDAVMGMKVGLLSAPATRSWRPTVSILASTSVPTGSARYRVAHAQPEVKLIGAWDLSDRASVGSNLNVARPHDGTRGHVAMAASSSLGYTLSERLSAYAEVYGIAADGTWGSLRRYADGGLLILLGPDVQFDMRVGSVVGARGRDVFFGSGFAIRR